MGVTISNSDTEHYPGDTSYIEHGRYMESGGWGNDRMLLTFKYVSKSFEDLHRVCLETNSESIEISFRVFLILSDTYTENDILGSVFPQVTFKGSGKIGSSAYDSDLKLIETAAEVGTDLISVGVARAYREIRKLYWDKILDSKKRLIQDGDLDIGYIKDSLIRPEVPLAKKGIRNPPKIDKFKSAAILSEIRIKLTRSHIEEILARSNNMSDKDRDRYDKPRIVIRVNYPEGDLENTGSHPRGHFIVQVSEPKVTQEKRLGYTKEEVGMKPKTERTSYTRID